MGISWGDGSHTLHGIPRTGLASAHTCGYLGVLRRRLGTILRPLHHGAYHQEEIDAKHTRDGAAVAPGRSRANAKASQDNASPGNPSKAKGYQAKPALLRLRCSIPYIDEFVGAYANMPRDSDEGKEGSDAGRDF